MVDFVEVKGTNGGLKKKIIKEGTGAYPDNGQRVAINYIGRLEDGDVFDQSSGYPFKFTIGEGGVIPGFDVGVKSMKKGEKALLQISPEMGYGEEGSEPDIPPNATLTFEVELVNIELEAKAEDSDLVRLREIRRKREEAEKEKKAEQAKKAAAAPPPKPAAKGNGKANNKSQGAKGGGKKPAAKK
eukprot:TRINITY_DN9299_c0_g1_i1.p1 TRINITY_DN9299_c0_g1~~TRINITY_DN9299_c0_g1_i1.p1  ORF type:complete len:186 (+),score=82.48 TRINITY_DN9299_c0_g1_i1:149-706(+)